MAGKSIVGFLAALLVAASLKSSVAQTTHVVGDTMGWVVPTSGASAYSTWAANKNFNVGDILVFNFSTGAHDVAEVRKAEYDACNLANPISLQTTGPANVRITGTGEHYFVCTFPNHCGFGQKLAINVTSSSGPSPAPQPATPPPAPPTSTPAPQPSTPPPSSAPAPQPSSPTPTSAPAPQPTSPTPTSAPSPAPTGSPVTYTVGGVMGWTVPPNGSALPYRLWAANNTFRVGDVLVFNYVNGTHNVAEVTKEALASCNTTAPLSLHSTPPTRVTLATPGEHFFTCTFPRHCSLGQQLTINVTGSASPSPSPSSPSASPSPSSTPPSPSSVPPAPSPGGNGSATPPPTPPGSSATSLGVTCLTTLSIALAILF